MRKYPIQAFVTRMDVQHMTLAEMEKSTSHCISPVSAGLVEDN